METLDKHFRTLTGASFAKRGRAAASVISHWPEIAGERLAAISLPERVRWPKTASPGEQGGVLVIRSAPGHGLDLQHEMPLIIERVNAFLGYGAVSAVKITQSHKSFKTAKAPIFPALPREAAEALEQKLAEIADDRLRDALKRLGAGALARGRTSPQPK
jgi:hypothetical protein